MNERERARISSLRDFMSRIGHEFADPALLDEALTHSSYAHELGLPFWNERLEFLGDAVLEVIVSEELFRVHAAAREGELTRQRSSLVREEALTAWGRAIGVDTLLRAGKGARDAISVNMIGDAVEAVIGALYIDGGLEAARAFVDARPEECKRPPELDAKTALQQRCQEGGGETPRYELLSREGPEHNPLFTVRALIGDRELSRGTGPSRKLAEQDAAKNALAIAEQQESGTDAVN